METPDQPTKNINKKPERKIKPLVIFQGVVVGGLAYNVDISELYNAPSNIPYITNGTSLIYPNNRISMKRKLEF